LGRLSDGPLVDTAQLNQQLEEIMTNQQFEEIDDVGTQQTGGSEII
jgi:hypothetical protein